MSDPVSKTLRLSVTRREFLISAAATTASVACGPIGSYCVTLSRPPRLTILGIGDNGLAHIESILSNNLATVAAIYDEDPDRLRDARRKVAEMTGHIPAASSQYIDLLKQSDSEAYMILGYYKERQRLLTRLIAKHSYVLLDPHFYSTLGERRVLREALLNSRTVLRLNPAGSAIPLIGGKSQLGFERQSPSRVVLMSNSSPQEYSPSIFRHIPELYSLLGSSEPTELPIRILAHTLSNGAKTSYLFVIVPLKGNERLLELHVRNFRSHQSKENTLQLSGTHHKFFQEVRDRSGSPHDESFRKADLVNLLACLADLSARTNRNVELNLDQA